MKKITKRKQLDLKCLKIWADIIKLPQKCAITGITQTSLSPIIFHAHHIISRRYTAGRYSLDNGLCLSQGTHFLEKPDPEKFRDMILNAIGENRFNELKEKYMKTCKVTTADLELIHAGLKLELKARKLAYLDPLPYGKSYSGDPDNNPRKNIDIFHTPME